MGLNWLWKFGIPKLVAFLMGFGLCHCEPRFKVVIKGTTVGPGFVRKEGVAAIYCPESHPWAMANGTRCCEGIHRADDNTQKLDWYDPESLCLGGFSMPCPSTFKHALCKSRTITLETVLCPQTHPVQMRNACCKTYRRKLDADCDGGLIDVNDDPKCCRNDDIFQAPSCEVNKKQCLAPAPVDVRTYCPANPDLHRIEGRDYALMSPASDSIPFTEMNNMCSAANGRLLPLSFQKLNDSINFLRTQYSPSELPRGEARRYLTGARKEKVGVFCFEKEKCSLKVFDQLSGEPIDFTGPLDTLIDVYNVTKIQKVNIALEIRLDPQYIMMTNVVMNEEFGSFLCEVECLVD